MAAPVYVPFTILLVGNSVTGTPPFLSIRSTTPPWLRVSVARVPQMERAPPDYIYFKTEKRTPMMNNKDKEAKKKKKKEKEEFNIKPYFLAKITFNLQYPGFG